MTSTDDPLAEARAWWYGDGRPASTRRALPYLRRAAMAGDAEAQWWLGSLYHDGERDEVGLVLPRNRGLAIRWYDRAVRQGHVAAHVNLGALLDHDVDDREASARALQLYKRAYRLSRDGSTAHNIGVWYRDRERPRLAAAWWARALADGDRGSGVDLGYCCQHGLGVRRNHLRAVECYRRVIASRSRVCEVDREEALRWLAVAHAQGTGVTRSIRRAVALLRRANVDDDFPEARDTLDAVTRGTPICRCRRYRLGPYPGNAPCALHRG